MSSEILSVRTDTPELTAILWEGTVARNGRNHVALAREKVSYSPGAGSVVFELIDSTQFAKPSWHRILVRAMRPESLTKTFTPGVCVLFYGLYRSWEFSGFMAALALLGAFFFQIAGNLFNDAEDHIRLEDLPGFWTDGVTHGSGVIQRGWVSAQQMRRGGFVALTLGVLFGLPSVLRSPHLLVLIGGAGILGVLGHSNRPTGLKYRALGDVLIFLLAGPFFTVGFSQAAFARVDAAIVLLGLTFGFLAGAISHVKNLQRVDSQRFVVSRRICLSLCVAAFTALGAGILTGDLPQYLFFTSLGALIPLAPLAIKIHRASGPASPLLSNIKYDAARLHFYLGIFITIGFLISIVAELY